MKGKNKLKSTIEVEQPKVNLENLSLKELRKLYPNVKATSKQEFLSEIPQEDV
jgi:hypothetical protein